MITAWIVLATCALTGPTPTLFRTASQSLSKASTRLLQHVLKLKPHSDTNSSYMKPEAQNAMLASHCKERYACEAFDYDDGRCNKAFFDTVCNSKASAGGKPTYPRRFSDLPGFEWFRDWPHSFDESCALSANLTGRKSADGQVIDAEKNHRLRALCHLHTRCVREHPDQCSTEGPCPNTAEAKLRNKLALQDVKTAFWALELPVLAHLFQFGGAVLFPVAIFMFFIVASEASHVHTAATQFLLVVEIAHQEHKHNKTHGGCSSKVGLCAARALQVLVRDVIVVAILEPTVMSILTVETSFDIVFCGAIAVVVLQTDQQLFSTIMTDASLGELSQEYSLVLTKRQHRRLQVELTVVFWSAFFWMMFGYLGSVQQALMQAKIPESPIFVNNFNLVGTIGFAFTTDLVVELWCTCREISEGIKFTKRELAVRFGMAAIGKCLGMATVITAFVVVCDYIFFYHNKEMQALNGDIKYEHPMVSLFEIADGGTNIYY